MSRLDLTQATDLGAFIGKTLASFVSGNNQPDMSGDDRNRIRNPHTRARYDRSCEQLAGEILATAPMEAVDRACCQKCGGEIQGWICQSCDQEFREDDAGNLVFDDDEPAPPMEAVAWRENIRRALDLALMVAEDLSKGYRDSDEEDDFMRCPACKGWIGHYGHTPTCDLVVLEKRAREGLQALAVIPTQGGGDRDAEGPGS